MASLRAAMVVPIAMVVAQARMARMAKEAKEARAREASGTVADAAVNVMTLSPKRIWRFAKGFWTFFPRDMGSSV
jgi:hypothetical protein